MSSIPGWTAAQVQQAQLQMAAAAAVSTASSSSLQSGISFVSAASSVLSANTQNSTVGGQKANPPPSSCRQLLSSGLLHSLPSRDSNVTSSSSSFSSSSSSSSETSCTQAAAESSCAGSFYGQMLTQTLMQNARPQPQPQQFVAQTTRDAVAAVGSTCGVAGNGGSASFVRVLSSGYSSRPVSDSEALGGSSHPTLPPSPQRGLGAGLVAFQPTDISMGSPASSISSSSSSSSSCLTPDHFLGPSPQSVTSPGSVGPMESPDTTELQTGHEADSGYSDHLTDKSTSLDKLHAAEDPELTSSSGKRKRVRKSRAKQQDPKVKILVRKTRRVRANDRERDRMHGLNDAMDELRKHLPSDTDAGKLTKIDTLRTASNYIKVLKMMLGEIEKGEDPAHWSQDMLTAVNSLYVQPAASPDSTDISSPGPHDFGFEDDSPLQLQQQNCGGGGHGLSPGGVMMPAPFPSGAGYQSCAMADAFDPNCDTFDTRGGGAVPCGTALQAPGGMVGHGKGGSVPVLGDSTNYGGGGVSLPVNMNAVMPGPGGYAGLNAGFVSAASAVNSGGYHPAAVHQQYGVVSGHCTSTQNMFLQSSQCY